MSVSAGTYPVLHAGQTRHAQLCEPLLSPPRLSLDEPLRQDAQTADSGDGRLDLWTAGHAGTQHDAQEEEEACAPVPWQKQRS